MKIKERNRIDSIFFYERLNRIRLKISPKVKSYLGMLFVNHKVERKKESKKKKWENKGENKKTCLRSEKRLERLNVGLILVAWSLLYKIVTL